MLKPFAVLLCAAALLAQDNDKPKADPTRLGLDLLLDWQNVADPRLSPDGKQIVYTRQWTDKIEDRVRSELWLMDQDGGRQRLFAQGSDAQWSPDGTRLCYIAEGAPKGSQIFVAWVATREATQITHVTESPSNLQWSPDSRQIAFNMQVPEKDGFKIAMPSAPKGAKWAEEPKVITRLQYRRDQSGYAPSGWRHVFVVAATGGTGRQVTEGDFDHGAPQWTMDGKELVFDGLREADADWQVQESELYAVDVESAQVRQLTHRKGPDHSPVVLDREQIAYVGHDWSPDTYAVDHLYVIALHGDNAMPRCLTPEFDRTPQALRTDHRGGLFFNYEDEGGIRVGRPDGKGGVVTLTPKDAQFRFAGHFGDDVVLGVLSSQSEPGAIAVHNKDGFSKLTDVHSDLLHGKKLAAVDELWWDSVDGTRVQGWLVKPPDFDKGGKYPLILQIHGGPHAMFGVNFDFERQNHAANGYLLLYTNPRGSTGYGKTFGNAINNAYPGKDYDDLMRGVDAVIAQGCVDEGNLFVYGGSGGGVLTAWIVGHTDRFRAAVSMFPVIDWISFVGTTDGPFWYHNFAKLPWDDITEHWNRSPLKYVGNVKTPTMLITGELDLRTPIGQTEEFYQALKLRKVDTVMVRVPDEYHGASGRHVSNRLRRILYVRTWFEKHKRKGDVPAANAALEKN